MSRTTKYYSALLECAESYNAFWCFDNQIPLSRAYATSPEGKEMRVRTRVTAAFAVAALVCAAPVAAHASDEPPLEEEVAVEVLEETPEEASVEVVEETVEQSTPKNEPPVVSEEVIEDTVVDEPPAAVDESIESDVQSDIATGPGNEESTSAEDAGSQPNSEEGSVEDNPNRYGIALSVDTEDATCGLPTRAYTTEDDPWQRDGVVTYTLDDVVVFSQPFYDGEFDFDLSYLIPQYRDGVARYIHLGATTTEDGLESSYYGPALACYALAEFGTWFNPYTGVVGLHINGDVYFQDSEGNIYTESTELPLSQETTFTPYPTIEGQALDPVYGGPWTYAPQEDSEPVIVTPVPPTQDGNTVTIPEQDGVQYQDEDGNVLPPGDIVLEDDLTVIAVPEEGYTFPGDVEDEWTFIYTPEETAPVFVTPLPPTQDGNVVTIPEVEGVEYQDSDGNVLSPGNLTLEDDLTVITVPEDGYKFTEGSPSEWFFEYTPPVSGGGDDENQGGDQPGGQNGGQDGDSKTPGLVGTGGDDGNGSAGNSRTNNDNTVGTSWKGSTLPQTGADGAVGLIWIALLFTVAGAALIRHGARRHA